MKRMPSAAALALACCLPLPAHANDTDEINQLKQQLQQAQAMMQSMQERLQQLEKQQQQTSQAVAAVQAAPPAPAPVATPSSSNGAGFNPKIAMILGGTYSNLSQDPADYRLQGFVPGGEEVGPGDRSFNLGESELTLSANVDPDWYGQLTLAVDADDSIGTEEAFVRTTSLPYGLTLELGRFFSGLGYINTQHAHAWDFVDAPLVYQAMFGGQYQTDGAQLKWLAPTDTFLEFGIEAGNGANYPGGDRNSNGIGASTAFFSTGDDIGDSASWKAGMSWLHTSPDDRSYEDEDSLGNIVSNSFSGTSDTVGANFVWKWAPDGNNTQQNLKVQGEYFARHDDGTMTFDTSGSALPGDYNADPSGWYLQSVYQFMPNWRIGIRRDQLHGGDPDFGITLNPADFPLLENYNPTRNSLMFDYSPSEFSRFRLQFAQDKSRPGATDNEIMLQYIMSLGTHGTHSY